MTQPTRPQRPAAPRRKRLSPDEIEARTRAIVIICLVSVLLGSVFALLYSLIFVYQPQGEQSPNDAAFLKILEPLMFSIGGALTGLAAGRAMSSNKKEDGE